MFHLEFHLPYLTLRVEEASDSYVSRQGRYRVEQLTWPDHFDAAGKSKRVLYESHVSMTIVGTSRCAWTAYCFSRSYDGPNEVDENVDAEEDSWYDYVAQNLADMLPEDPREYWLSAINIRLRIVVQEWSFTILSIESSINDHVRQLSRLYSTTFQ